MLRRVTDLCFLKMPVNAVQYRVTVGIFNNRKLITNLRFELPSCLKLSNNLQNYDANYIPLLFYIFLIAFLFSKGYVSKISTKLYISIFLLFNILLGVLVWLWGWLIILSGDVEVNWWPKNIVSECLSICHWNLNSISAHNYSKLFLLKAYMSVHKLYCVLLTCIIIMYYYYHVLLTFIIFIIILFSFNIFHLDTFWKKYGDINYFFPSLIFCQILIQ